MAGDMRRCRQCHVPAATTVYPTLFNINRNVSIDWEVVPLTAGAFLIEQDTYKLANADGTINHYFEVRAPGGAASGRWELEIR